MEGTIRNAKISGTRLGYEDHGIVTAIVDLNYGGSGQDFGLYSLSEYDKEHDRQKGTAFGMEFIIRTLDVVGAETWEELKGRYVRVQATMNKVISIGNIVEDKWFTPADLVHEMGIDKEGE